MSGTPPFSLLSSFCNVGDCKYGCVWTHVCCASDVPKCVTTASDRRVPGGLKDGEEKRERGR